MDETTKIIIQVIALFVGVIAFAIWATKPMERVKEVVAPNEIPGYPNLQYIIIRCPNCKKMEHRIAKDPKPVYWADFVKCGDCGHVWKYKNLTLDERIDLLEQYGVSPLGIAHLYERKENVK